MKNIYEVIRKKELELQQIQKELDALRIAAALLQEATSAESATHGAAAPASVNLPMPPEPAARSGDLNAAKRWP